MSHLLRPLAEVEAKAKENEKEKVREKAKAKEKAKARESRKAVLEQDAAQVAGSILLATSNTSVKEDA